ncbi:unnamed protein product, partial [Clonostachys rosea f. rosea IK726]
AELYTSHHSPACRTVRVPTVATPLNFVCSSSPVPLNKMVNTGKPSSGCLTCRKRKVKCDMQRPACRRCLLLKRECLGYSDPWTVVLRQVNDLVAEQVQVRVRKRLQARRFAAGRPQLPKPVHLSLEYESLLLFHESYVSASGISFFRTLPVICSKTPGGPLQSALEAAALASAARRFCQSNMMALARRNYGRAINSLNNALCDPVTAKDDTVLVSLFVLGLFETIAAEHSPIWSTNTESNCHPHSRGGLVLLEYRADNVIHTAVDVSTHTFFSYIALMEYFLSPPGSAPLWSRLLTAKAASTVGPVLEPLLWRAVQFKSTMDCAPSISLHTEDALSRICDIIKSGLAVADELKKSADAVGSKPVSSVPTLAFNYLISVANEKDAAVAKALYLTVKLHLVESVWDFLLAYPQMTSVLDTRLDTISDTSSWQETYDAVSMVLREENTPTVSSCLGYRAFCMMWPLSALMQSRLAASDSQDRIKGILRHLGASTGLGICSLAGR